MPRGVPRNGLHWAKQRKLERLGGTAVLDVESTTPEPNESVEEIGQRIQDRFSIMHTMAKAAIEGTIRSLFISGPPGIGKSYGVFNLAKESDRNVRIIKGQVRPTGIYKELYEARDENSVLVFDDADSIFSDETSLNLLKSACDTTRDREICWLSETKMESEDGEKLPRRFEFNGSIIFITNLNFDAMIKKGHRLAPHFDAMMSRSHYIDMAINSKKELLVRINHVVYLEGMLDGVLNDVEIREVMHYIAENSDKLREVSLRMCDKVAGLRKMGGDWKKIADTTCSR